MKTKSFLAAMMAAALSFNFMACSDDDEPNGGNGGGSGSGDATKRLTRIFVQCPNGDTNNETTFKYDNEGRVTEMAITYEHHNDGEIWKDTYSYSYSGNNATISTIYYEGNETEGEYTTESNYTLNDKGYVTSGTETRLSSEQTRQYTFSYTDDYMTLATESYDELTYEEKNQIISDGQILPHDWDAVEYTDIPNKGNLFFHYANESDIFDSFEYFELYWVNLAGKAPAYLPQSVTDSFEGGWHFSYKLDDEGYATEVTITNDEGERRTTITCTYEDIN